MYMETSIIRGMKEIDYFEFYPNQELDIYLRAHERAEGGSDWFGIHNLTENEISTIKSLLKTEDEKK